jgi:hypothetical protein
MEVCGGVQYNMENHQRALSNFLLKMEIEHSSTQKKYYAWTKPDCEVVNLLSTLLFVCSST